MPVYSVSAASRSVTRGAIGSACVAALLFSSGCGSGARKVATSVAGSIINSALNPNDKDSPTTAAYVTARCADGTYTYGTPQIPCDSHGGIDVRFDRP